jgi:hypothetical protein
MFSNDEFLIVLVLVVGVLSVLLVLPLTLIVMVKKLLRRQQESVESSSRQLASLREDLRQQRQWIERLILAEAPPAPQRETPPPAGPPAAAPPAPAMPPIFQPAAPEPPPELEIVPETVLPAPLPTAPAAEGRLPNRFETAAKRFCCGPGTGSSSARSIVRQAFRWSSPSPARGSCAWAW